MDFEIENKKWDINWTIAVPQVYTHMSAPSVLLCGSGKCYQHIAKCLSSCLSSHSVQFLPIAPSGLVVIVSPHLITHTHIQHPQTSQIPKGYLFSVLNLFFLLLMALQCSYCMKTKTLRKKILRGYTLPYKFLYNMPIY